MRLQHRQNNGASKMKQQILAAAILSALLLQGCGGGSSDDGGAVAGNQNHTTGSNSNNAAGRDSNTGKAEKNFVATASAKYMLIPFNGYSTGGFDAQKSLQDSDGAFKVLGPYRLTGDKTAVQDIEGNENFALGRWSYGTANKENSSTGAVESTLLQQSTNLFWNYAVFNQYEAVAAGEKTCEASAFTRAYKTQGNGPTFATTTGTAKLNLLAADDATLEVTLTSSNGQQSYTSTFYPGKKADYPVNSGIISGSKVVNPAKSFVSNGEYQVSFGQGLSNEVLMIVNYKNQFSATGPAYAGLAVFTCK